VRRRGRPVGFPSGWRVKCSGVVFVHGTPGENRLRIIRVSHQYHPSGTQVSPEYHLVIDRKGECTELSQALCDFQVAGEEKSADVRRWCMAIPTAACICAMLPDPPSSLQARWDGTFFLLPMQTTWLFQTLVSFGMFCKNDQYIKYFS
jgi:hypothetical protein